MRIEIVCKGFGFLGVWESESPWGDQRGRLLFIINILTAIELEPGGSSPVHIYREYYIEYTNNTQNT